MKTLHKWILGTVAALGAAATVPAQQPAQHITFDDAMGIALRQNSTIKTAQNAMASGAASVQSAKLQFLPDLRVNGTTSQNVARSADGGVGSLGTQTSQAMNAGLSSSFTLFDGFKNASNLRSAQASEQASVQDLTRAKQTVVFNVASNFLSLVTAQEQLAVQQQSLAEQTALGKEIQAYVNAGERPISDLYQQEANVANANASVVDAQRTSDLAKVDLIQTLQLDPAGTYDFAAPNVNESAAASTKYDLQALIDTALAHRPDLTAQSERVNASEQDVRAAASARYPSVSVTAGYNTTYNSALSTGMLDQLGQRQGGSLAIGVSIPIFDRGAAETETEKAQLAADDAKLALVTARQNAALDVRRAYLDFQSAQQRLVAAVAQQKAADMALSTTQQRYEVGKATLVEVTQARTTQVQAATALVSARYNLVFQRTLMSYYTGELNPGSVSLG